MKKLNIIDEIVFGPDEISRCNRISFNAIQAYYNLQGIREVDIFVILEGAKMFSSAMKIELLFDRAKIKFNFHYIKAQSYDKTQSTGRVDIDLLDVDPENDVKNKNILIVDDIYDTGNTLYELTEEFKKHDPKSIEYCVLLEREVERNRKIDIKFVSIKTNIKGFFIGYGLDHSGSYRNLPYIATLNDRVNMEEPCEEIRCNYCGENCKDGFGDIMENYGLINARVKGGYYSPALDDLTSYRFDLCERCLLKMFAKFKLPVSKIKYDPFTGRDVYGE